MKNWFSNDPKAPYNPFKWDIIQTEIFNETGEKIKGYK